MRQNIETRIRKLEDAGGASRLIVVFGHSDEEHEAEIEALKRQGRAAGRDMFVCIMQFSDAEINKPVFF